VRNARNVPLDPLLIVEEPELGVVELRVVVFREVPHRHQILKRTTRLRLDQLRDPVEHVHGRSAPHLFKVGARCVRARVQQAFHLDRRQVE
jgi:hypothetical protein